ncbi:glucose-6-phosphate exchanger SLC37A2-like [Babylonia areolata]|uniref:glucose-6-phosphate exchanger SLC37A2-like n=1 Tax=Babylonia areolata TaxID=304850 RepID=UPI003FD56203
MSIALGIRLIRGVRRNGAGCSCYRGSETSGYQLWTLVLTFLVYASYHMSRKPLSIVKNTLHRNCSSVDTGGTTPAPNNTDCSWAPFDGDNYDNLFGWLDVAFLGTYAVCMFGSGFVAERINLRYFLTVGMLCTGASVAMFGVGYFLNIHNFAFYLCMQVVAGGFQSSGWPAVVAAVGNWFGPGRRGVIMGIWNSHTSVGNILGAVIPAVWANGPWGWSFVVPGAIIGGLGIIVFFFLVPYPSDVGIEVQNSRVEISRTSSAEFSESTPSSKNIATNTFPGEESPLLSSESGENDKAVSLLSAIRLPGVLEFSLCLFFAKLVSYTFLFWLPKYIGVTTSFSPKKSANLSTLFDVGGVGGGIIAGLFTDRFKKPAICCVVMLILGTPLLFIYQWKGGDSYASSVVLLLVCGALVNGPYALITTAVSAELGTQPALKGNKKALATVTSIIDGTGSIGAALGPLLTGLISPSGWQNVFYMLIGANVMAGLFLIRIVIKEVRTPALKRERERECPTPPAAIIVQSSGQDYGTSGNSM